MTTCAPPRRPAGRGKGCKAESVALPSWPGSSGPSVAARAGGDGPDKPDHDDRETLLRPPPYPDAYGDTPGYDGDATASAIFSIAVLAQPVGQRRIRSTAGWRNQYRRKRLH